MQQPRRSLSASNLPVNTNSSNNNNTNNNNNNGSSNTPVVESVHQDKRINYHELMQMLGTENLQHASLMMGASMHPNNVDPTTPLSANSHHHLASFVHPNATAQMSTTQLLLEELNSAVDHTHHQATLQMLASGTNTESNNSNAPTTNGNSIVNNGSTAALLSAAAGHHPYHYYPSQYSPYLYHPLSHPIHPIHFSSHTPLAALYDQSAAAAVLLQQQQLLNHSLHSLPTASSTATINPQQQQQSTATVQQPTTTISNNNTVSNVVVNQNIPSQQTSQNVQNITSNTDEEIEDDSDSKPMDCKKEGDNTSECEENREWSNCQVNRDFLDSSNVQVNIYLETRDSGPRNDSIVESELYSSIKYEMRHEIKCLKFLNESDNDLQLFCRVQIIHPDNKNEVLKNGKTILGGVVESNVSKGNANENIASTSMKIKFTDCSYHHGNCKFAFRVSYFIESDLDNPILIKESASFKVLARKPSKNKTKKQASKRKRKEEEAEINTVTTTTTTPQSSPQKVKISSFDDFKQVTTSVFDYIQTNTDEQKKRQMINYVITKLYSVDPNIMFSLPTDDGANDIFKGLL